MTAVKAVSSKKSGGASGSHARNVELFFRNGSRIVAVSIEPGSAFATARVLFEGPYGPSYDVGPDGEGSMTTIYVQPFPATGAK